MAGLAKRPEDRSANCALVLSGDGGRGATALPVHDETAAASDGRARTPAAPHTPSMPHEDGRVRAPRIAPPSELAALGGYPRGPQRWPIAVAVVVAVILAGAGLFHYVSAENEKRRNLSVAQTSYERAHASLKEEMGKLESISREDGFGSRIDEIAAQVPTGVFFDKVESLRSASGCCETLGKECQRLVAVDALRIQSKSARDAARKSKQAAQTQCASQDAQQTWQEAEAAYAQGQRHLSQFDFDKALQSFKVSGGLYEKAVVRATAVQAERKKAELARQEQKARDDELRKKREKEVADSREACEEARRHAVEAEANKFATDEMLAATQSFLVAEKAAEANQQQAYQTAMKAFERAREVAQEASKPKVTLKAMLNGEEVNATVVSGLKSKDKKTPVVVDLSGLEIGKTCEFELAYVREEVPYGGRVRYLVNKGKGDLSVALSIDEDKRKRLAAIAEENRLHAQIVGVWQARQVSGRYVQIRTVELRPDGDVVIKTTDENGRAAPPEELGQWRWKGDVLEVRYRTGIDAGYAVSYEIHWIDAGHFEMRYADLAEIQRIRNSQFGGRIELFYDDNNCLVIKSVAPDGSKSMSKWEREIYQRQ